MKLDADVQDHALHVGWGSRTRIKVASRPPGGRTRHINLTPREAIRLADALVDLVEADAAR